MTAQDSTRSTNLTLDATIKGRVQGVGFRVFAADAAHRLGLRGYVRNLPDGSVQVVAHGGRPALDHLLALLQRGPAMAHVSSVEPRWSDYEPRGLGVGFEVRH